MSQVSDYNLANQAGTSFRSELNDIVAALLSNAASTIEPSAAVATPFMWWADSSALNMNVRNSSDSLFIKVFKMTASTITPYVNGELLDSPVQSDKNQTFTKAQRGAVVSVTYASTLTLGMANGNNYRISPLTGALTLANPSSVVAGQSGSIWIPQDGTGSRVISFGTFFSFTGGTVPTLSSSSSAVDRLDYAVRNASTIDAVLSKNVS